MHEESFLLTVCVPTYNRAAKLDRVLGLLRDQILSSGLGRSVRILVSDNASTDSTPKVLDSFDPRGTKFETRRSPENIGFDGNVWELYRSATTPYVWFFSDDDIPFDGCVAAIHERLLGANIALLLYSFVQPPNSTQRLFDLPVEVDIVTSQARQAELATTYPKLSIYIMRRLDPTPKMSATLGAVAGAGFAFVTLALEALSSGGRLVVLSKPLAGCDEDYAVSRVEASIWGQYYRVFDHPFIARWAPHLAERSARESYFTLVSVLWAWRKGVMPVTEDVEQGYWNALTALPLRWRWLATSRQRLAQALILKIAPRIGPALARSLSRSAKWRRNSTLP